MATTRQLSFASGEIAPALYSRVDLTKYSTGLRTCLNWMVMRHGGITNRPGTGFVGEVNDSTKTVRVIPFIFNSSQTYILEFGDLYMRVIRNSAQVTETAQTITGATQADPCVITIAGHSYSNGDEVFITDVGGMTELNSRNFKVNSVAANTFELQEMDSTDLDATGFTAYTSGGTAAKIFEITTPYAEADLSELRFIQSADIVTITHPSYAPRELARTAHTAWNLTAITFGPILPAPTNLTSDAAGAGFSYKVTAIDSLTGEETLPSVLEVATTKTSTLTWTAVVGATHYNVYRLTNGVYGWIGVAGTNAFTDADFTADVLDEPPADRQPFGPALTITDATQADPCVLTVVGHGYSTGDEILVEDVVGMVELNDNNYLVVFLTVDTFSIQTLAGVDVDSTAFTAYDSAGTTTRQGDYPSTVAYFQQRLVFANTDNNTEGVWSSKSALRKNLMVSTPIQDDDAVTFSILGREVNEIHHLLDLGKLIMFTESGEWVVDGDAAGILTPSGINPRQHTANGSGSLAPLVIDGTALFVQSRGSVVRDLGFDFDSDGYRGNELSIFSSHLVDKFTLVDWAYQQIPHSIAWAVRSDGTLLGLTYLRNHQILGWHRHTFAGGTVENVAVIPQGTEDVLYLVIKRTINGRTVRYIEFMKTRQINDIEDSVFMDSSLSLDGRNTGATTMTLSGGTTWAHDEDLTLTASVATFTSADVGNAIWITDPDDGTTVVRCSITAFTSTTIVTVRPSMTVPIGLRAVATAVWSLAVDTLTGLWHLEGEDVSIFADGQVMASPNNTAYTTKTVANGTVTFTEADGPHAVVHVGLPITADTETLNIDSPKGTTLTDEKKLITKLFMLVEDTRGLFAGADSSAVLTELKIRDDEDYDEPVDLETGTVSINIAGESNDTGKVFIRQIDPVPATILSIVPAGYLG